ncbi:MAG: ATP-binding protein [Mycobacteriales bacterium]
MSTIEKSGYDDLPDGVLVADADGRVVVLNPAAERLLGTTADAALGRDYREVLPLADSAGRDWWACTDPYGGLTSRRRQPECQLTLANGCDLLVTASYIRGPDRGLTRLVVALRDTHARERIERSRANLVSTVAHELRSPLTSVKGFTATLLAKWDRFNDDQKKVMLQTVNADADRVTRLITELLDVSRIDAGRLEMRKQVVDLPAATRKAIAGHVAAGEPEGRFEVRVLGELPEMWVDPDKFQQVIGNLVENALRHGAGTVTVTVGPDTSAGTAGAVVTVADEGEGIPEAVRSRIFGRFWRGGDRRGGTGLGLYIVKGLVEAHGGRVSVGCGPAGGAEFRFVLPAGTPDFL